MGLVYADVEIENCFNHRSLTVSAVVDSGAVFLCVPEHIAVQLGFDATETETREVRMANGHVQAVPIIGPLRIRFAGRHCDCSALVLGDETLFGAVPMEMMDLVVHPATRQLSVHPESPYVPRAHAKSARRAATP